MHVNPRNYPRASFYLYITAQSPFSAHLLQLYVFLFFSYFLHFPISSYSFSYPYLSFQLSPSRAIRRGETAAKNIELIFSSFQMCFGTYQNWYIPSFGNSLYFRQSNITPGRQVSKGTREHSLSKSLLLAHFYSGHSSIQWMNSIISQTNANNLHREIFMFFSKVWYLSSSQFPGTR